MRRFLRETWELWYWAMFCPSKLQQRMNAWSQQEEDDERRLNIKLKDIIYPSVNFNFRFFCQYLCILIILSFPLILFIWNNGRKIDVWLVPMVLMTAYAGSYWFLSISFAVPEFLALVYWQQPGTWFEGLRQGFNFLPSFIQGLNILPSLPQNIYFSWVLSLVWMLTLIVCSWLLKNQLLEIILLIIGRILSAFIRAGIAGGIAGGISGGISGGIAGSLVGGVAGGVVVGMAFGVIVGVVGGLVEGFSGVVAFDIAGGFSGGLAFGIAGGLAEISLLEGLAEGLATLPLSLFLLAIWLTVWSLSPVQEFGLIVIGIFTVTGIFTTSGKDVLAWQSLWAVPVGFVGYYRLFPDYLIFLLGILVPSIPVIRRFQIDPLLQLTLLPPHTSELLWLPFPNHDKLLATAFRIDVSKALETWQKMQESKLSSFQPTLQNALPQIIVDRLYATQTTTELITTASPEHPLLPLLIPSFYTANTEPVPTPANIRPEISILVPRLQSIAQDVEAALESKSAALRERGLERILNNLALLQAQLPGLGLKPKARERWQPVLQRWQRVIELELEAQQQQSIGELLNPFLYGNPLKRDRPDIFKGRQTFADEIVRQILDRNRPTLVLHGPRRCGKTSFLYNLPRLLPSDLLPIFADMQSAAATQDDASFCYALVRAIAKDSRSQGVQLPELPPRQTFRESPYIALEDWFDRALPKLGDRRLLLNLDEFEKIGAAIHAGKLSLQLFDELRHLIQHYDALGFLFCGVQTLDELGPNWSSYFISVVPMEMLYLEPEEAAELLVNPDREFQLRYETDIVDTVVALTRSHPYLVQLLGSAMVMEANQHQTTLITPDLLEAAIDRALTLGEPYFTNVWTEFTGTTPEMVAAGQELLIAIAENRDIPTTNPALPRLLRYHILEPRENGSYDFEVPLLKRWVQERAVR